MRGLMMDTQLLISSILRHADQNYGNREIVSITADNPQHRYTYADCFRRTIRRTKRPNCEHCRKARIEGNVAVAQHFEESIHDPDFKAFFRIGRPCNGGTCYS